MNNFIEENYQSGLITDQDLHLYLDANMITQQFYNELTKTNDNSKSSSSSFNPVA